MDGGCGLATDGCPGKLRDFCISVQPNTGTHSNRWLAAHMFSPDAAWGLTVALLESEKYMVRQATTASFWPKEVLLTLPHTCSRRSRRSSSSSQPMAMPGSNECPPHHLNRTWETAAAACCTLPHAAPATASPHAHPGSVPVRPPAPAHPMHACCRHPPPAPRRPAGRR